MTTNTLHHAVHHAVLHEWDPIGLGNIPEAQNEYDAYVPKLCELLRLRKGHSEITRYLWWLATEQMGLTGNRQETEAFTERLIQIATTIERNEPMA
jgi:hypothetical protein